MKLTGYEASFIRGRNLRFLQGDDHEQEGLDKIRSALRSGAACQTTLRNYRRDGSMFWNEVTIQPLRDGNGNVTHFAGFHREVGDGSNARIYFNHRRCKSDKEDHQREQNRQNKERCVKEFLVS